MMTEIKPLLKAIVKYEHHNQKILDYTKKYQIFSECCQTFIPLFTNGESILKNIEDIAGKLTTLKSIVPW